MNRVSILAACILFSGMLLAAKGECRSLQYDARENSGGPEYTNFRRSLYIQLNVSALFASLSQWQLSLHNSDGSRPSANCTVFGGEAGIVLDRHFQAGIGYEFLFTPNATTIEVGSDQISGTFLFGTLKAGFTLDSAGPLFLFGRLDAGTLSASESMEHYIIQNFERSGTTFAFRLMIGAQYFATDNWSVSAEAGYFKGVIKNISALGTTAYDFKYDFNGPILRASINYHIPL